MRCMVIWLINTIEKVFPAEKDSPMGTISSNGSQLKITRESSKVETEMPRVHQEILTLLGLDET